MKKDPDIYIHDVEVQASFEKEAMKTMQIMLTGVEAVQDKNKSDMTVLIYPEKFMTDEQLLIGAFKGVVTSIFQLKPDINSVNNNEKLIADALFEMAKDHGDSEISIEKIIKLLIEKNQE